MPRTCTICRHDHRADIESALVQRQAFRTIADQFGVSKTALLRHFGDHLPAALLQAHQAADVAHADAILSQVQDLRDKALAILKKAEKQDELRTALGAIREARGCLELLGRLAGELEGHGTVNVIISPEWRIVQNVIIAALEPHQEARLAVASALGRLDNGHARL